ncbi:MAG: orotidine-5'-phosphate decarboxylase [Coriobacteriia bacterium]|nr:orotidine-5'-phosphate decarboxylase [Coriobacteriia bacterium]
MSEVRLADRLIVALDLPPQEARTVAGRLSGRARWVKVGMTAYYREGPALVRAMLEAGFEVFVDLKLHDIPHQVRGAAEALGTLGSAMLTVHASGGAAMIEAAVEGARAGAGSAGIPSPAVVAVTILTSMDARALASVGAADEPAAQVARLTRLARDAGAAGVVCSPREAAAARALLGDDAVVVTPGVRPRWASTDDQVRVATPAEALAAGASHLVIGRPITRAEDPAAAFDRIVTEAEGGRPWEGEPG